MIQLSTQAEFHGQQRDRDQSTWLRLFESAAEPAFQKTRRLRTRLVHTGCEFNFLWPSPREAFDQRNMQIDASVAHYAKPVDRRVVAFTSFPGLEVTEINLGAKSTSVACKAFVKLYPYWEDIEVRL
jgi:hypothetical protein